MSAPHCSPCSSSGMTVLQCVSVTLKRSMRGVEGSRTPSQARLQALRQEQMMETLECLLQMTTISPAMTRRWKHTHIHCLISTPVSSLRTGCVCLWAPTHMEDFIRKVSGLKTWTRSSRQICRFGGTVLQLAVPKCQEWTPWKISIQCLQAEAADHVTHVQEPAKSKYGVH